MLVVVFLKNAKKKNYYTRRVDLRPKSTIVEKQRRKFQSRHLIFWSKSAYNTNGVPNPMYAPNFSATKSLEYPPKTDQACFLARVLRFFGKKILSLKYKNEKIKFYIDLLIVTDNSIDKLILMVFDVHDKQ